MTLRLVRTDFLPTGIFGELQDANGIHLCYTLEHSYDSKPKLNTGIHTCIRGSHNLHSGPIETFEIKGVPGHSGILLHPGNTNSDSDGCVLVGQGRAADSLMQSKAAFTSLMNYLSGLDQFELIVS